MKYRSFVLKSLFVGLSLLVTTAVSAQFGNSGEYVAGDGLTTYSSMDPMNMNNFAAKAKCGTVTRFTRYQNGQVLSLPNNQTCQWIFRDGNGTAVHTISQFQWNGAVGSTYQLPGSNIKLTVNAINSTFIELLIERINPSDCNTSVVGLSFQHSGSGGSNSLNPLEHTCTDDCSVDPDPISCPVTKELLTCCGMNCLKLTKLGTHPSCPTCYCVKVTFTDGTTASFDASFSHGNEVMHCYNKPIASYVVKAKPVYECNECVLGKSLEPTEDVDNSGSILIFPNPAKEMFQIQGDEKQEITEVKVLDINGKEVKSFIGQSEYYSTEGLERGMYIVQLFQEENELKSVRLVID
mgnify:CR=1 FL=1